MCVAELQKAEAANFLGCRFNWLPAWGLGCFRRRLSNVFPLDSRTHGRLLTRRPMPLLDAASRWEGGRESVAVPLVVVAVRVPVEQVKPAVKKGGVAIDMIAGRANCNIDAIGAVADGLVVVQVVVAG